MSFFFDNKLTTIVNPSTYSVTGAYAVNGDTRYNIGVIRAVNSPDGGTGSFNYLMLMAQGASGATQNNYLGIFKVDQNGTTYTRDTYVTGFADYAEYFETFDQLPLDYGTTVSLVDPDLYELVVVDHNGDPADEELQGQIRTIHQQFSGALDSMFYKDGFVRATTPEDDPTKVIGVVRPNYGLKASSVVGNSKWSEYANKYIMDEFGIPKKEPEYHIKWSAGGVNYDYIEGDVPRSMIVPPTAVRTCFRPDGKMYEKMQINPYYDYTIKYKGRAERPEWVLVGLLGQVPVLNTQLVNPNWVLMGRVSDRVNTMLLK